MAWLQGCSQCHIMHQLCVNKLLWYDLFWLHGIVVGISQPVACGFRPNWSLLKCAVRQESKWAVHCDFVVSQLASHAEPGISWGTRSALLNWSAFITTDQRDPKDQGSTGKKCAVYNLSLQLHNCETCGRDKPSTRHKFYCEFQLIINSWIKLV